jgi:hypothetical protein
MGGVISPDAPAPGGAIVPPPAAPGGSLISGLPAPQAPQQAIPRQQQATALPTAPAPQPDAPPTEHDKQAKNYVERTMELEGSGKDPNSSAVGGFINSTWLSLMRQTYPQTAQMPDDQVLAMRSDPKLRAQMTAVYGRDNAGVLQKAGFAVDNATLRLAHWFGPDGAIRVLSADPSTPVDKIFPPNVIAANPPLAGRTAGQIVELTNQQMAGGDLKSVWTAAIPPEEQQAMAASQAVSQQTASSLTEKFKKYEALANSAAPGSAERDEAITEMRKASAEMQQDYRHMMMNPPVQKPVDAWANFGSAATLIGLLGGLLSRQHITAGLNAAGEAMQAINTNNSEAFERSYKTWQNQSEMAHTMISMENEDIRSLLEDKRLSVDEKNARLQTMATEMGFIKSIGDVQKAPFDAMAEVIDKRVTAASQLKNQTEALKLQTYNAIYAADTAAGKPDTEARAHALAVSGIVKPPAGPSQSVGREAEVEKAVKALDDKWDTEHPDANQADKDAAHSQNRISAERDLAQATHAPRSAPAMFMQKFVQEHPDADSDAMAMAAARYRQMGAMEQAFGSGAQGNTIRSLNVAIDHTDVLKQISDALQNGDTQKINALRNRMLVEFGYEGPVDFDVAKKIVNDEIIKSVLGIGAGTGQERLELQQDFSNALSPEQLNGVIQTARRLMLGQMRGLEYQYAGADEKRQEMFRGKLFEHTKEALESTDKGTPQGGAGGATEHIQNGWRYSPDGTPIGPVQ